MFNTQLRPQPGQSVCYYGRVSTPKQKLEHQREMVQRWLDHEGIDIPPSWYFEDKEKRHKSDVRQGFQQVLQLAKAGKIEWIVVACFDRWGVASTDEFYDIRRKLKETGVRLYSVQDQLDLTSADENALMRIVMLSIAATTQMGFYADRNILKMVSMAQGGWHASKEHPYGTDLMCCRLTDRKPLFRVHCVSKDLERKGPRVYKVIRYHEDGTTAEEIVTKMPPRDCKQNGYRLVPSIDKVRIETVRLIHELFDQGMTYREIGHHLHAMGRTYYGKLFGPHAIESILRNPAYIGRPAWGKMAYGNYRQVFQKTSVRPKERMAKEPRVVWKDEEHFVYPTEPVFDPETFVPLSLWERVQKRFNKRPKREYTPRRASKTIHPLNGLMMCPDCGRRMVASSSGGRRGERVKYYICGSYNRSGKIACKPNSVKFVKVDRAMAVCWKRVCDKLKALGEIDLANMAPEEMLSEAAKHLKDGMMLWFDSMEEIDALDLPIDEALKKWREQVLEGGDDRKAKTTARIAEITQRLEDLAERIGETNSKTVRTKLNEEAERLEREKERLEASNVGLVERIQSMLSHAIALHDTLEAARQTREGEVWETFLDRVEPVFEVLETTHRDAKNPTQRICTAFRFVPKTSANHVLPQVLEIQLARTDRDSPQR